MLVHFEQVLSDLKHFRTILVKKLFRLQIITLLEMRITSKRFSVLFAFFKVLTVFWFCVVWTFWSRLSEFEIIISKRFGQFL